MCCSCVSLLFLYVQNIGGVVFNSMLHNIIIILMWGNLITETAFAHTFSFGFPTNQSDILMHLTHWQYWFWFWFTYYMVLYYFIFLRLIRYRVLKMSPKLSTSFRSHGKWGDLLVCFIPLSWCTNILSNSNFILRMIEWQSESSLFTLRIRGKQWYWVYKFELKSLSGLSSSAVNWGSSFWLQGSTVSHHALGMLQANHNLSSSHVNWTASGASQYVNNTNVTGLATNFNSSQALHSKPTLNSNSLLTPSQPFELIQPTNSYLSSMSYAWRNSQASLPALSYATPSINFDSRSGLTSSVNPEVTRVSKVTASTMHPVRLLPNSSGNALTTHFNSSAPSIQKPSTSNFYLVIKQKRYAPSSLTLASQKINSSSLLPTFFSPKSSLFLAQHSANRTNDLSLQSNRRLLRTKRVLVLPAHTNITLITNSFDVMHSWYIPGLGVKLDCVPGRSTHHTIHIDHAGFYYGQCAEICGRYHHHMPIRVCALPFEHFLIWWYHYGAPFFLAGNKDRSSFQKTSIRGINW